MNDELVGTIRALHGIYKTGLLSNFTFPWLDELLTEYALRPHFDHVLISSLEKMIKPNPEIFHEMLRRMGVAPEEAMFFDDKAPNVDAARALGLHAFLFTDNDTFKKDLLSFDISI